MILSHLLQSSAYLAMTFVLYGHDSAAHDLPIMNNHAGGYLHDSDSSTSTALVPPVFLQDESDLNRRISLHRLDHDHRDPYSSNKVHLKIDLDEVTPANGGETRQLQSSSAQEMIELINTERRDRCLPELCVNVKLTEAAQKHSDDMQQNVFFSHTGSNGSEPWDRVRLEGYDISSVGENISTDQSIPDAHQGLMNSRGHRDNILYPFYTHIGIGVATYTSGNFDGNLVITQVFGSSNDSSEPQCDGASSSETCADNQDFEFSVWNPNDAKIVVGCDWILKNNVEIRRQNWCNGATNDAFESVVQNCPRACNSNPVPAPVDSCSNNQDFEFSVWGPNDAKIVVGCDWILNKNVEIRRQNWCNGETNEAFVSIVDNCPQACGQCDSDEGNGAVTSATSSPTRASSPPSPTVSPTTVSPTMSSAPSIKMPPAYHKKKKSKKTLSPSVSSAPSSSMSPTSSPTVSMSPAYPKKKKSKKTLSPSVSSAPSSSMSPTSSPTVSMSPAYPKKKKSKKSTKDNTNSLAQASNGDVVSGIESPKPNPVSVAAPVALIASALVGVAFFVRRRRLSREVNVRSLPTGSLRPSSNMAHISNEELVAFPIDTNSLNNEFEVSNI